MRGVYNLLVGLLCVVIVLALSTGCSGDDNPTSTTGNVAPSSPANPIPMDASSGISTSVTLRWSPCVDPEDQAIVYDVYFGSAGALSLISEGQDTVFTAPGKLNPGMSYAWRVVARDAAGAETVGTAWFFTTTSIQYTDIVPALLLADTPYATESEPFDLDMPTGNRVHGLIRRPIEELYPGLRFPGVVVIPGGINPGRVEADSPLMVQLAETGMVVVCYNAEGRVSSVPGDITSEGVEDYNGYVNQDNLAQMIRYTLALQYVNDENVGIATFSFGVTTAAGCLARHPELPVKYFVDGEGPSRSFVTCHEPRSLDDDRGNDKHDTVYGVLGHYSTQRDTTQANRNFWSEREAIHFIGAYRGRYMRLQGYWDHIQPPLSEEDFDDFELAPIWWHNKHTTEMVAAAVDGGVPWVLVNPVGIGNMLNATYDAVNRPIFIPGTVKDTPTPWYPLAINEMARLEAVQSLY
ncbi:hypothetical protein ACFL6M_03970 [Candidatus Eisenbacteria bacterium]|uniref:Fibronectin type-III domain-containing protein n=1 Tax=Eiseniibacteriota bacterium TaxID=2212470 RepID=A0ABV6YK85_UNCEI